MREMTDIVRNAHQHRLTGQLATAAIRNPHGSRPDGNETLALPILGHFLRVP